MSLQIRRFLVLAIALGFAAPVPAQQPEAQAERETGRKPLNLSLPRDVLFPPTATTREDPTLRENLRTPSRADDAGSTAASRRSQDDRDDSGFPPYGTGFEARQRGGGAGGGGGGAGGSGGGGGRGRGR